jgi:hypothetical protein
MAIARSLFRTEATINAPCSVKAIRPYLLPPHPELEVTFCDLKIATSLPSMFNTNSPGNLRGFLLTACFKAFVVTP